MRLRVGVTRCPILYAVLLLLPAIVASQPAPLTFTVDATLGWQTTTLEVAAWQELSFSAVGDWSVDPSNFSYVGPDGYTPEEDSLIQQGCKLDPRVPYGKLLAKVGDHSEILVIGSESALRLGPTSGVLSFRINEVDACLGDNAGSVTVTVTEGSISPPSPPPPPVSQPNLQPIEITFDSSTVGVGDTVFFDSGVRNSGDVDSGIFNIKWFINGQEVGADESHSGVPAGQTVMSGNSQFSWTFDRPGAHSVTFAVDVNNHVEESNEGDNATTTSVVVGDGDGPVPGPPLAMVTLSINPRGIIEGQSATLSWSSTNTTTCIAGGDWSGSKPTSGSEDVIPDVAGTTTYTLECTGAGGRRSASATLTASTIFTVSPNPPNQTINATVRDFRIVHPDFESGFFTGLVTGLVSETLPPDKKPDFVAARGAGAITSASTLDQWYNDVPGVNMSTTLPLTLTETAPGSGIFEFKDQDFFPIDGRLFGNEERSHNYHFTLELHNSFTYQPGQTFHFSGDDDLWVYINNQLVIDLGGVHGPVSASIDLDTLGLTPGNTYDFDLYFAERHTVSSVFHIQTSIVFNAPNLVVLVHGCCTNETGVREDWESLGMKIEDAIVRSQTPDRTPEAWDIVVWDWHVDTPILDPIGAYKRAVNQGHNLANAIANHRYEYVHLIGHSAGSNLIDTVAGDLFVKSIETGHKPFVHLTFLDAFTPENNQFSYGMMADFAEHYVDKTTGGLSPTDADLTFAFNFDITGWIGADKGDPGGHQWPRIWYTHSIDNEFPGYGAGHLLSLEGGNEEFNELTTRFPPGCSCELVDAAALARCGKNPILADEAECQ